MPEGVGYGPQYTASTGKELNVIGNHAYAYSGNVSTTSSNTTMLKFTTGNYLFVGGLEFHGDFAGIGANNTVTRITMGSRINKRSSSLSDDFAHSTHLSLDNLAI